MCNPAQELRNLGGSLEDLGGEFVKTLDRIAENPLPIIETIALTYILGPAGAGIASAAAAPAIASAATSALNGGNLEQIVLAAATSYAGGQLGEYAGSTIDFPHVDSTGAGFTASGLSPENQLMLKQIVTSASGSAATEALRGRDFDEILAAATSAAVGSLVKNELVSQGVDPKSVTGETISNASNAVTRAILSGSSVSQAFANSVISTGVSSAISAAVASLSNSKQLKDLQPEVTEASKAADTARTDYLSNIDQQKSAIEEYNSQVKPLQELGESVKSLSSKYDQAVSNYNNYDAFMRSQGYSQETVSDEWTSSTIYAKKVPRQVTVSDEYGTYTYDTYDLSQAPQSLSKDSLYSQANSIASQVNSEAKKYGEKYTELFGGEVTKYRTETQKQTVMQQFYDGSNWEGGYYYEAPVEVDVQVQVPYTETVKGTLPPIKEQIDALKVSEKDLAENLKQKQEKLNTVITQFTKAELDNANLVSKQINDFATASKLYKNEFGADPTEAQLKSFADSGDIIGYVSNMVADNNALQVAKEAGFNSFADYRAAGNISPNDYYAQKQGWKDYADQLTSELNGFNTPTEWNTHLDNEKTAKDAGFFNYSDYQSAGEKSSDDFYAQKDGWDDYSQKQSAEAAGYKSPTAWDGHITEVRNEESAKAEGFPDYATKQQYGGNFPAYTLDQNNAKAVAAGFPDFDTQTRFGGDVNEYKANQEGWQSLGEKQAAAGYDIKSPEKYQEFISGKTEEDKVVQMLQDRGIPATPERVADIMKSWDFNPTTPNVGFSDAFNQSDKLNVSNSRADTVQEAAALAKSLGYSTFSFGGGDYKLNTAASPENPYNIFASFDEAFKAARQDLGAGQTFEWTDPQSGKTGYFTTNLAGEKVPGEGFDPAVVFDAKSRLVENLQDMKVNPADLNFKDMTKFVDQFANATPAQRAALLNGSYSSTFKVINDALTTTKASQDNTLEAIKSGNLDPSKPIEGTGTIKPSDVTNYKQILSTVGNNVATDIASTALSGANIIGSALGLNTSEIEGVQKLLSTDKNKQMDKLIGLEKNAAAGIASAIESGFSYALGGAPGAIGAMTSFAANSAWLEGKEAKLSNTDNAIRTATMAAIEAAGEAVGIPGLSRMLKGVPLTGNPSDIVNAVKNFSMGLGNEQVSELATTAAQFAVDKFTNFGLGKNATYQDFVDAMKDTVLTTAFAVGGSGSIGQASRALQAANTAPTPQLWSQNLPEEIWSRIKDAGISQSEVDALKSNLGNSFGSENYTVQQAQQNFEAKLKDAGFTDQEIARIAEPAALDVISEKVQTSLEKAGVPAEFAQSIASQSASQILDGASVQDTFGNLSTIFQANGLDPLDANLITNQTLTGTDVRKVVADQFKAQGYTPTQVEIDNLISQNATALPAAIASSVSAYSEPRTVTKEEAKASLVAAGIANPTEAQINALVGQYDQGLLQSRANTTAGDISTQLSNAETASFDRDAALSKTLNDLSAQVTANQSAGMNSDQALQTAISQVATNLGTTKEDLLKQFGQTEQGLKDQIAGLQQKTSEDIAGVQTQLGVVESTLADKIAANEASGMARDQAIEKAVSEVAASVGQSKADLLALIGQTQENLTQQYASGQLQLEGKLSTLDAASQQRYQALSEDQKLQAAQMAQQGKDLTQAISDVSAASQQQITGVETKLSAAIEAAKQSGLQGDAALQSAINTVAGDLGTTKEALLAQIGTTEAGLRQDFAGQIGGVQTQIGNVQTALESAIADARAAGLQGDQALQSAINTVAGDLGTTKDALLAQIGSTEAGLRQEFATQIGGVQTQIGDVKAGLEQAIKDAQASGLQGDQALQSAIDSVASNLGTTKDALLAQIGSSESQLRSEMQAGQALTSSQIAGLESQLTEQSRSLVAQLQQQGVSYQQALSDAIAAQNAQAEANQQQTAQQIASVKDSLTVQITANEAAGLSRDEATTKAINDLSAQMGVDKSSLLTQLGTTEQALRSELQSGLAAVTQTFQEQYNALSAAQKAQFDAMVEQGASTQAALAQVQTGLQEQITGVQSQLTSAIAANEAAGLTRDQALSKAITDVSSSLGTTKESLLSQLGKTEETLRAEYQAGIQGVQQSVADIKASLQSAIDAAKASGLQGDSALQSAITAVSTQMGVDKQALLGQLGTTEQALRTEFQAGLAGMAQTMQEQYNALTAAQKAQFDAMVQQGADINAAMAQVQAGLQQQIGELGQTQAQQYNQLSQGQKDLYSQLVAQGATQSDALNAAVANLSQTQAQQYSQLSQGQKDLFNQMLAQGASQAEALNSAISGVQGQITGVQQSLEHQLAQQGALVQQQYAGLSAAQQAEVAARIAQGESLQNAIASSQAATSQQISGVQQALQAQLAQQSAQTQQAFAGMSAAQQAEVAARIQQGQDLQTAISGVQASLGQQITGGLSALSQEFQNKLAASDAATQAAFGQMTAAQQAEAQARVQQGQDLQAAITASQQATQQQITGGLSALSQEFQAKLAASDAATQGAFAQMSAAQQAETLARVQQGQDLQSAISAASQAASQQIAGVQQSLQNQLAQQGAATQQAFANMSAAQQAEVQARIAQGESLQSAIAAAQQATSQQITGGLAALSQDFQGRLAASDAATQAAFASMTSAQQAEAQARVQQGQDLQSAISASSQLAAQQLAQAQAALEGQLSAQGKQFFDALRQQGLDYNSALQQAIDAQNQQIAAGQQGLTNQIGALSQATQQQYANLTAAQRQEVADRVAQGESLQNAIAASQQATQEQISAAQRQAQEQYNSLSAAQKAEADARVAQGQSLQSAISDVQSSLTQQGQQTQQQINALSQQTQNQYNALTSAQQAEVAARVAQGQSFDAAIAGVGGQLSSMQAALEAQRSADEAYRQQQAQKAAADAAKAAQGARMSTQSGVLAGLAGLGAAAAATEETRKPLQPRFLTSKGGDTQFKGLLSEFQQEVEGAPNMQDNTGNRQEGSDMSPYYSYGNETSLDQILGGGQEVAQGFARGGLATPLMASGGTTGTRYGRYAAGGEPRGIPRSGGHPGTYPGVSPLMAAGGKMRVDFRHGDAVTGPGDGQSDDIPAMLADGEFVFPADVVAALGNGSTKAGSDKLYDMMHSIRAHVRSAKPKDLPPEIKSPLDFLKTSKTSKKRSA